MFWRITRITPSLFYIILHNVRFTRLVSNYIKYTRPSTSLASTVLIREIEMYREENSLRHVALEAKFLVLNKLWSSKNGRKKWKNWHVCLSLLYECSQEQNGSPSFFSIVRQCNGRLFHQRLLRSITFATTEAWRHTSPIYYQDDLPVLVWTYPIPK